MKTIGLIGGITWHSTLDYYRMINEQINEQLGGVSSARIILYSVNFADIKELTEKGDWATISKYIQSMAQSLRDAGAECLLLGANTMHKVADEVQESVDIPLFHIAVATAEAIKAKGLKKVGLLGTKYVMEMDFYKDKLIENGITAIVPGPEERIYINAAIYDEMGKGLFLPDTKQRFLDIIESLVNEGAEGIILGCTEIPILIKQEDCGVPVFDTTKIHVDKGVRFALQDVPVTTS